MFRRKNILNVIIAGILGFSVLQGRTLTIAPQFTGLDTIVEAAEIQQRGKVQRVDVSSLRRSLEKNFDVTGLKAKGWYIIDEDKNSDRAVIIIPEHHPYRRQTDTYNHVFDIVSKYAQAYGLEGVVYSGPSNVRQALESFYKVRTFLRTTPQPPSFEVIFKDDEFVNYIAKSDKTFFGLEEESLVNAVSCMRSLSLALHRAYREHFDKGLTQEQLARLNRNIKLVYDCAQIRELPPYTEEIWQDRNKFQKYLDSFDRIFFPYADIKRSQMAARNALAQLDLNAKMNITPNIVAIQFGGIHIEEIKRILSANGVSYIGVMNDPIDKVVQEYRRHFPLPN